MNIRDVIGQINFMANKDADGRDLRQAVLGTIAIGRKAPRMLGRAIREIGSLQDDVEAEVDSWIGSDEVARLQPGRFDVSDLRIWLNIAAQAGVKLVPAREIMRMDERELDSVLACLRVPEKFEGKLSDLLQTAIVQDPALARELEDARVRAKDTPAADQRRPADLLEAAFQAMEEIPASWMVRTHLAGSSNLKALVGTGVMFKGDDTARLAPDVEVGAGWAQIGNRRVIDFRDRRFIEIGAKGHKPETIYLARPWAQPARFHEGEDLHRAGSPLAGPGKWPAEWRVFVKNGAVTGVANYYGWTGEGRTAENAWNAIEAAGQAHRMVRLAGEIGLSAGHIQAFFMRRAARRRPEVAQALESWDPDGLHATLDFLETERGLTFLEAGPGHEPGGGGHPVAFAGQDVDRRDPERSVAACRGVAYRAMDHVHLAEPQTWVAGDPEGCIDEWAEAAELARDWADLTDDALSLLDDLGAEMGAPSEDDLLEM